jgi:cytochrome c553
LRAVIPYFFSAALLGATCVKSAQIAGFPDWAYPPCVRAATEADNSRILSVAGSKVHFTEADLARAYGVACDIFIPASGRIAPLRQAILEMPIDVERFERRDPHTAYIAYVPKGSVERGRQLASAGDNGRTQPCVGCHGADLRSGPEFEGPPLAGRFASYLFRQLYGFQSGARAGDSAQPMQFVVAKLTQADMIDLAAYAASLKP